MSAPLILISNDVVAYSCSGTPADCVKLTVLAVLPRRPSLVVSGINHGSNTGINVIYSGTISAATEGTILGIPSAAFSVDGWECLDFGPAKAIAYQVAGKILEQCLPPGTLLNVNIPNLPVEQLPPAALTGRDMLLPCMARPTGRINSTAGSIRITGYTTGWQGASGSARNQPIPMRRH